MRTLIASILLIVAIAYNSAAQQINKAKGTPSFGKTPDYLRKIDQPVFPATQSLVLADHVPKKYDISEFNSVTMRCNIEGEKDTIITVARSLQFINQQAIKSLEILKDADA